MSDDGFEVLDANDDMHIVLGMKVVKVINVDSNCGLEWLLEDLCPAIRLCKEMNRANIPFPSMTFSVKLVKTALPSLATISSCSVLAPKYSMYSRSMREEICQPLEAVALSNRACIISTDS